MTAIKFVLEKSSKSLILNVLVYVQTHSVSVTKSNKQIKSTNPNRLYAGHKLINYLLVVSLI